jgi:hypothetical protein
VFGEAFRAAAFRPRAEVAQAALHVGVGVRLVQHAVQPGDDVRRRAARGHVAEPGLDHDAGHAGLGEGRHVRQGGVALAAGDGDGADLPGADRLDLGRDVLDHHLHLVGEQRLECRRAAAEGHMYHRRA